MNTLVIVLVAGVCLAAGYLFYGRWLAKKWGIVKEFIGLWQITTEVSEMNCTSVYLSSSSVFSNKSPTEHPRMLLSLSSVSKWIDLV